MKIKHLSLVIMFLFFIGGCFLSDNLDAVEPKSLTCTARLIVLHNGTQQNLTLTFIEQPKLSEGTVIIEGDLLVDNKPVGIINRSIEYVFSHQDINYSFVSKKITSQKGETVTKRQLEDIIPDFFLMTDAKMIYNVFSDKNSAVFSVGKTPRFYCAKLK